MTVEAICYKETRMMSDPNHKCSKPSGTNFRASSIGGK